MLAEQQVQILARYTYVSWLSTDQGEHVGQSGRNATVNEETEERVCRALTCKPTMAQASLRAARVLNEMNAYMNYVGNDIVYT